MQAFFRLTSMIRKLMHWTQENSRGCQTTDRLVQIALPPFTVMGGPRAMQKGPRLAPDEASHPQAASRIHPCNPPHHPRVWQTIWQVMQCQYSSLAEV